MSDKPKSDHDLLVETHTDVKWMKDSLVDHLKAHTMRDFAIIGTAVTACLALFGMIVSHFFH
jgi:hypothetical protein